MTNTIKKIFFDLIRLTLAFIFVLASVEKLKNPYAFALSIDAYQIFSEWIINFLTVFIPWIELFIAFGFIFKFRINANLFLYLLLMISFTILVLVAVLKGLDIECGCFGESSTKVGLQKILENILIIAANVLLMWNEYKKQKIETA